MNSIEELEESHIDAVINKDKGKLYEFAVENDLTLQDITYLLMLMHVESFVEELIESNNVSDSEEQMFVEQTATSISEILDDAVNNNILDKITEKLEGFLNGYKVIETDIAKEIMVRVLLLTMMKTK